MSGWHAGLGAAFETGGARRLLAHPRHFKNNKNSAPLLWLN
jgi:hypothetical protein